MTGNRCLLSMAVLVALLLVPAGSYAQQSGTDPEPATGLVDTGIPLGPDSANPSFKSSDPPVYPKEVLEAGIGGTSVILMVVDREGDPVVVAVDRSSGNRKLDQAAVDSGRYWKFIPGKLNGAPAGGIVRAPVKFRVGYSAVPPPQGDHQAFGDLAFVDTRRLAQMQQDADHGDVSSDTILGHLYENGLGVTADKSQAAAWYGKAADQGYAYAEFTLGLSYFNGTFTPEDHLKSREWFEKAAGHGYALADFRVGAFYETGDGVPKDSVAAARHYQAAAAQGDPFGEAALGLAYMKGAGVPEDDVLAYAWLSLASRQNIEGPVPDLLAMLTKTMAPAAIEQSQALAGSWKKGLALTH